jgi:hypothetical protein
MSIALIGRKFVILRCLNGVRRNALAFLQTHTVAILPHGISLVGGKFVVLRCLNDVLRLTSVGYWLLNCALDVNVAGSIFTTESVEIISSPATLNLGHLPTCFKFPPATIRPSSAFQTVSESAFQTPLASTPEFGASTAIPTNSPTPAITLNCKIVRGLQARTVIGGEDEGEGINCIEIRDSIFRNQYALIDIDEGGGAIYHAISIPLHVIDVTFDLCVSQIIGGCIASTTGEVTILRCCFYGSQSVESGMAVWLNDGRSEIDESNFYDCGSEYVSGRGVIFGSGSSILTMNNVNISSSPMDTIDGAAFATESGTCEWTMNQCTMMKCVGLTVLYSYSTSSRPNVEFSNFYANEPTGSLIFVSDLGIKISGCVFRGNTASIPLFGGSPLTSVGYWLLNCALDVNVAGSIFTTESVEIISSPATLNLGHLPTCFKFPPATIRPASAFQTVSESAFPADFGPSFIFLSTLRFSPSDSLSLSLPLNATGYVGASAPNRPTSLILSTDLLHPSDSLVLTGTLSSSSGFDVSHPLLDSSEFRASSELRSSIVLELTPIFRPSDYLISSASYIMSSSFTDTSILSASGPFPVTFSLFSTEIFPSSDSYRSTATLTSSSGFIGSDHLIDSALFTASAQLLPSNRLRITPIILPSEYFSPTGSFVITLSLKADSVVSASEKLQLELSIVSTDSFQSSDSSVSAQLLSSSSGSGVPDQLSDSGQFTRSTPLILSDRLQITPIFVPSEYFSSTVSFDISLSLKFTSLLSTSEKLALTLRYLSTNQLIPSPSFDLTELFSSSSDFDISQSLADSARFTRSIPLRPSTVLQLTPTLVPSEYFSSTVSFDISLSLTDTSLLPASEKLALTLRHMPTNPLIPSSSFDLTQLFSSSSDFGISHPMSDSARFAGSIPLRSSTVLQLTPAFVPSNDFRSTVSFIIGSLKFEVTPALAYSHRFPSSHPITPTGFFLQSESFSVAAPSSLQQLTSYSSIPAPVSDTPSFDKSDSLSDLHLDTASSSSPYRESEPVYPDPSKSSVRTHTTITTVQSGSRSNELFTTPPTPVVFVPNAGGSMPESNATLGVVLGVLFGLLALVAIVVAIWLVGFRRREETEADPECEFETEQEESEITMDDAECPSGYQSEDIAEIIVDEFAFSDVFQIADEEGPLNIFSEKNTRP